MDLQLATNPLGCQDQVFKILNLIQDVSKHWKSRVPHSATALHLKKILDAVHDNVILGPAKALHIDGHDLGPDAAEKESIVVAIVLCQTFVGSHGLRLTGMDLAHHSSVMCQGAINRLDSHLLFYT